MINIILIFEIIGVSYLALRNLKKKEECTEWEQCKWCIWKCHK